jgi:hypothetical protein
MKRLKIVVLAALMVMALTPLVIADTYTFRFPTGLLSFKDHAGTEYLPSTLGLTSTTDIKLIPEFLHAGMIPVDGVQTVLYRDNTTYTVSDNTNTVTTSISLPAGLLSAGRTIRMTIGGTTTGTTNTQPVTLYLLDGVVSTLTIPAAAVGSWRCQWLIQEYTDTAHQNILGSCSAGSAAGATSATLAEAVKATKSTAAATPLKTYITNTAASADSIVQTFGLVEYLP